MADTATAVNDAVDAGTTTAPAPVEAPQAPVVDTDSFDLDESDFADDPTDTDEGEAEDNESDEPVKTPDGTPDESDDPGEEVAESETEEPVSKADTRKEQLNTEIRDLVAQRNAIRQEVEQLNTQTYEARTADQIAQEVNPETGEYYTALEARVQAQEERIALAEYNNKVAEAQLVINSDAGRVLQDFPMFDSRSDSYNKDIAESAASLLDQNYIKDANNGQIIGTHLPVYDLYKLLADANQLGVTNGELKGQQAAKKMMATADTVSSAGPKSPAKDAFLEGFDKIT